MQENRVEDPAAVWIRESLSAKRASTIKQINAPEPDKVGKIDSTPAVMDLADEEDEYDATHPVESNENDKDKKVTVKKDRTVLELGDDDDDDDGFETIEKEIVVGKEQPASMHVKVTHVKTSEL